MPESTIVKTKRDGSITIEDLGAVNTLTVNFEAGDLSIEIPGATVNNFLDRGRLTSPPAIRYGEDQPITGTFTAYLRDLSDATYATLAEIITQTGDVGANWVSTMGAAGEVFAVKMRWTIEGTDHGDPSDHVLELDHCYLTGSLSDGDPDTISLSFTSYVLYPVLT